MLHSPMHWVLLTLILSVLCPWKASLADVIAREMMTLSEQAGQSDASALVERISVNEQERTTKFVIRHVTGEKSVELKPGETLVAKWPDKNEKPGLRLLFANETTDGRLEWSCGAIANFKPVSEELWKYLLNAPKLEIPASQRLQYFLKFLESDDPAIAHDAFFETDLAHTKDILENAGKLPLDKLREWLKNPEMLPTRRSLYAKMVGFCGDQSDAEFLLAHIREQSKEFRLELEGYCIGYLWLTGEKGLDVLDELKLRPKGVSFSECYAAMQALRFMVGCGQDRIGKERLCQSMGKLLDRPELADLVVADLARWEDWSVQDRLMQFYGEGEYAVPSIKRAFVRFYLACGQVPGPNQRMETKNTPTQELPSHAVKAREYLNKLRQRDPKTVKETERFWVLPSEPSHYDPCHGRRPSKWTHSC